MLDYEKERKRQAEALSEILSDRHGVKVTVTFNSREEELQECEESSTTP